MSSLNKNNEFSSFPSTPPEVAIPLKGEGGGSIGQPENKQEVVSITYEEIGLFPRSFSRVLDRFLKQVFSDVENLVIQEYRFYRYLFLTTLKCLLILFFIPFFVNFLAKTYVVRPLTEYFWNTKQTEIFLNSYQQKRAFAELKEFEEKTYFESLIFPKSVFISSFSSPPIFTSPSHLNERSGASRAGPGPGPLSREGAALNLNEPALLKKPEATIKPPSLYKGDSEFVPVELEGKTFQAGSLPATVAFAFDPFIYKKAGSPVRTSQEAKSLTPSYSNKESKAILTLYPNQKAVKPLRSPLLKGTGQDWPGPKDSRSFPFLFERPSFPSERGIWGGGVRRVGGASFGSLQPHQPSYTKGPVPVTQQGTEPVSVNSNSNPVLPLLLPLDQQGWPSRHFDGTLSEPSKDLRSFVMNPSPPSLERWPGVRWPPLASVRKEGASLDRWPPPAIEGAAIEPLASVRKEGASLDRWPPIYWKAIEGAAIEPLQFQTTHYFNYLNLNNNLKDEGVPFNYSKNIPTKEEDRVIQTQKLDNSLGKKGQPSIGLGLQWIANETQVEPKGPEKQTSLGIQAPYNMKSSLFVYQTQEADKNIQQRYQEKTIELAQRYNDQSIEAITNLFADLISLLTLFYLLYALEIQINITKSFLLEVFFGLDDSKKSLLILLITDLLVGYHSSNLWELFFEFLFHHYGLPESQTGIFLLVATLPVLLDVLFKYLIFRHLNRSSPATVATYHAMIE